ncbi:MAG: DoxX family protein [Bacteroidetes bacterium]|nr:MAG: DoxX family protein [Bacteroidota bacterium]
MNNKLLSNIGLLILRVAMAASLMTHGYPKFLKLVAGNMSFPDPLGIGEPASLILTVFGEFIAPIFILVGFKTRFAAIPPAIAMGVAVFIMHGADPFSKQEHAFLYFAAFIAIALLGAGKFSLDGILRRR